MTDARVATVDVYLLRRGSAGWETLVLQRAEGTRCTGAWEVVHGRIEPGERPEEAAIREVGEETGLTVERLYNVMVQPFYLHMLDTVTLAVVFAAFVGDGTVTLGAEHARAEWLPIEQATERLTWPRSRAALRDAVALLATGDAGPVEDVLRVR
ncbi:MAG: NUDIX domain-containing protein [Gemmatimonadaceae bacterium]|nr:NUDIX domain-containing protein [Gemmatimonadaceae bacterium]